MARDKASRKMNVQRTTVSVCGCRDNAIQNPPAYIFPYISIFNMYQNILVTCTQWLLCFFSLYSFTLSEFCLCHIVVILHSLFTGNFFSHLKRGTTTKASIILHCVLCLNVTQWLLCCCVRSHTTHWLAALQIVSASSYPISAVREIQFEGFLLFHSGILFLCMADFWHSRLQFAPTLQRVLTGYIHRHIYQSYFNRWISNKSLSNLASIVTVWVRASINKMRGCRKSHRSIRLLAF